MPELLTRMVTLTEVDPGADRGSPGAGAGVDPVRWSWIGRWGGARRADFAG